jgi:branched-chain amino acid transport system ATP-binding protein
MIEERRARLGLTVLMAEQNFHQAIRIADRGYLIVHGCIAFEGASAEALQDNALVRQVYFGL